jgi:WD40 repeat protein
LQKRPTAVVVIYSASILHIVEAFILAESKAADTSIPIASLLDAFGGHRITLVATMLVSALLALTVAADRTVRLWQADGIGEQLIIRGHQNAVFAASFSPDGVWVVSAGRRDIVRFWRVFESAHALIEAAQAALPRQLTDTQRARYPLPPRGL